MLAKEDFMYDHQDVEQYLRLCLGEFIEHLETVGFVSVATATKRRKEEIFDDYEEPWPPQG